MTAVTVGGVGEFSEGVFIDGGLGIATGPGRGLPSVTTGAVEMAAKVGADLSEGPVTTMIDGYDGQLYQHQS